MPIYTLPPPANRSLPVASPRACDTSLMHALIRDRSACVGWAKSLEPRLRHVQLRYQRGIWQSDRELRNLQRSAAAVLKASHAHRREIDRADLAVFDALQAFLSGQEMTPVSGRAA
jgi:hypothetical protein